MINNLHEEKNHNQDTCRRYKFMKLLNRSKAEIREMKDVGFMEHVSE